MIEIDGSHGEGGGQVVRTAVALSVLTQKPIHITNIRKGRTEGGLKHQHVEAVHALASLCNATVEGASVGSSELFFDPKPIRTRHVMITIPTAGSIALVLQGIMIAAAHAPHPITIDITGGSISSKWAAPVHYIKYVLFKHLAAMNYACTLDIKQYGYYPKGCAHVQATLHPATLKPLVRMHQGTARFIEGISHASETLKKAQVAERQQQSAQKLLEKICTSHIAVEYHETTSPGSAIDLWCTTTETVIGADALGEREKKAEDVGKEAAEQLLKELKSGAGIDHHAADQLLPYLALATNIGESKITTSEITEHARTNAWVIEQFLPVTFVFKEKTISCKAV
ncbi:MAG: RNA 3'-terminal phosphate cyclase [Candidatus Aenigmarchaeota archaeon]|nr:RNA 3'-terminal phosphate cyclase [Candidatus Aenigmarchaeota archaeon]